MIELRTNRELQAVEPPVNSPVWIDGHGLRRQIQNPLLNRMLRRFFPDERRHPRLMNPPLVGYLGSAGSSKPFEIVNVSVGGFCLKADEYWTPGTVLTITLERSSEFADGSQDTITVPAMVVRREEGAAGFAIAMASEQALLFPGLRVQQACDVHRRMARFLERLTSPVAVPLASAHIDAPKLPILDREQRFLLLIESAKNYKLSDAWSAEDPTDDEDTAILVTSRDASFVKKKTESCG